MVGPPLPVHRTAGAGDWDGGPTGRPFSRRAPNVHALHAPIGVNGFEGRGVGVKVACDADGGSGPPEPTWDERFRCGVEVGGEPSVDRLVAGEYPTGGEVGGGCGGQDLGPPSGADIVVHALQNWRGHISESLSKN